MPTPTSELRIFSDPRTGIVYHAWEAPHERRRGGISPVLRSLVFETALREWVGAVRIHADERLGDFTDEALLELLPQATKRV